MLRTRIDGSDEIGEVYAHAAEKLNDEKWESVEALIQNKVSARSEARSKAFCLPSIHCCDTTLYSADSL